jgi:hypothetical protein
MLKDTFFSVFFGIWGILGGTLACAGHLLAPTIREGVVEG